MRFYVIMDLITGQPVFNVFAGDGKEALLGYIELRNLHADYILSEEQGIWTMTNQYGSRYAAVLSVPDGIV
ncbi:MAG: hypothetical protein IJ242_07340 [Clostridia bacterium]|nr:hypothetical protein [Clostridia bacterium]